MDRFNQFHNLSILLADDDDVFRETTAKTLKRIFQNVYTASDGVEALNLYYTLKPQIIMLDIRMGNFNGLNVAREIRKEDMHVPIFMVSSYLETAEILEACELNLVKYLVKPFTYNALLDVLKKCLSICNTEVMLLQKINESTYYNPYSKVLINGNIHIALTKNEITVLEYMLSKKGQIISYDVLINIVGNSLSNVALQNLIFRLRKKIGDNSIHNLAKVGYILV